jgi:hypothetical protein
MTVSGKTGWVKHVRWREHPDRNRPNHDAIGSAIGDATDRLTDLLRVESGE